MYVVGIGGVAGISLKGERRCGKLATETGGRVFLPSTDVQLAARPHGARRRRPEPLPAHLHADQPDDRRQLAADRRQLRRSDASGQNARRVFRAEARAGPAARSSSRPPIPRAGTSRSPPTIWRSSRTASRRGRDVPRSRRSRCRSSWRSTPAAACGKREARRHRQRARRSWPRCGRRTSSRSCSSPTRRRWPTTCRTNRDAGAGGDRRVQALGGTALYDAIAESFDSAAATPRAGAWSS